MSPSVYLVVSLAVSFGGASPGTAKPEQHSDPPSARTDSQIFERARRSVFVVETESGHGSGFLVDARGLIITNDHVLGRGPYLAVGVTPERKYPAVIVARDLSRDLALIRIHPQAVEGLEPLRFNDAAAAVTVGERVLAIGSALSQAGAVLTTGIVSRLEADTIIADLNVNAGSSGGPLLNLNGEVVGLCTFFVKAPAGPGLAGVVRAHAARAFVAKAAASLTPESPLFEALPVASPIPYPADALHERAGNVRSLAPYGATVRRMRIDVLTPPVAYFEAHQREILQAQTYAEVQGRATQTHADRNGYTWKSYAGQVEAIIGIRAVPDVVDLAGSEMNEAPAFPPATSSTVERQGMRFTSDVREIRLFRNGVEVVPIVPGRFCRNAPDAAQRQPAGCFGLSQYLPSAFEPGAELELRVYSDDETKPRVWKIPSTVIKRVWEDFGPWRAVAACPAPCTPR